MRRTEDIFFAIETRTREAKAQLAPRYQGVRSVALLFKGVKFRGRVQIHRTISTLELGDAIY